MRSWVQLQQDGRLTVANELK